MAVSRRSPKTAIDPKRPFDAQNREAEIGRSTSDSARSIATCGQALQTQARPNR